MATKSMPNPAGGVVADQRLRKLQTKVMEQTSRALLSVAAWRRCTVGQVVDDVVADTILKQIDVEGLSKDRSLMEDHHAA